MNRWLNNAQATPQQWAIHNRHWTTIQSLSWQSTKTTQSLSRRATTNICQVHPRAREHKARWSKVKIKPECQAHTMMGQPRSIYKIIKIIQFIVIIILLSQFIPYMNIISNIIDDHLNGTLDPPCSTQHAPHQHGCPPCDMQQGKTNPTHGTPGHATKHGQAKGSHTTPSVQHQSIIKSN